MRAVSQLRLRPDRVTPVVATAGAAVALLDCVAYQLIVGGRVQPALAAAWAISTVLPWALAWTWLRRRLERGAALPPAHEATAMAGVLVLSVLLDLLLIDSTGGYATDALARLQSRLPGALMVPALARLALRRLESPVPAFDGLHWLAASPACTAAGNYVEAEVGGRCRLVRATMREAEAALAATHLRIHRGVLVARSAIVALERSRHGIRAVRLVDGRRLPVGRSYQAALRRA